MAEKDEWVPVGAAASPAASARATAPGDDVWVPVGSAAPVAPASRMSVPERIGTGMADPVHGLAQMLYHVVPEGVRQSVDSANNWLADKGVPLTRIPDGGVDALEQRREQEIEQTNGRGSSIDWWRLAGNLVSPVNLAASGVGAAARGAGAAEKIGGAILGGAAGGASQPVADSSSPFWTEKAKQAGMGAAGGAALGVGGQALGHIFAPTFDKATRTLLDLGVTLTPGQMSGGYGHRVEDAISSVPFLGAMIRSGQKQSVESFNRAAINLALDPIGVKLPKDVSVGRDAVEHAERALSDAYNSLLPKIVFRADQQFVSDLGNLRTLVTELPPAQAQQFENIFVNRVQKRLDPNGVMLGHTFKEVESELATVARQYRSSSDGAQRQMGVAVDELRSLLRQNLERANPAHADELGKINSGWARFVRIQEAAARRAQSDGVFTPGDLSAAVKKTDTSVRKGRYAKGGALMQDASDAGSAVLPRTLPDSGTPERLMWAGVLGEGFRDVSAAGALAALGLSSLYTAPGMTLSHWWARAAPAARAAVREKVIERGTQALAPGAGEAAASRTPGTLPPITVRPHPGSP